MDVSTGENYAPPKDENADSSDDEKTREEELKEVSVSTLTFSQPLPKTITNIVVCSPGAAKSLAQIIFGKNLVEIGKVDTKYREKESVTLRVYYVEQGQLLVIIQEPELKDSFSGSIVHQLFSQLLSSQSTYNRIVILDTIYKTQYSTTDTGCYSGEEIDLRYYKTSFVSKDHNLTKFLEPYAPAGVLNILKGFAAQMLIHAELNGLSAVSLTAVVDSHYVTLETLQAFEPVVDELLGIKNINFDELHKLPNYKDVLKDENQRGHNIFN